jgi:hypothetical protein
MTRILFSAVLFVLAAPAPGQWTRVGGVPAGETYSALTFGDTLYVSVDRAVYVSENGGGSWEHTEPIRGVETPITALLRTGSGLLAGTLSDGVYETADGTGWTDRSEGLAGLGAKSIAALVSRDATLYAGTIGAGVFRRDLSLTSLWTQFNDGIPSNLGWNINSLTNIDGTLWAGGGENAIVYRNRQAENSWTDVTFASFSPLGTAFLAATSYRGNIHAVSSQGLHRSTDGGTTWTFFDPGAGYLGAGGFAHSESGLCAFLGKAAGTYLLRLSEDDSSWSVLEFSATTTFTLAGVKNRLFAGRLDGLWVYDLLPSGIPHEPAAGLPGALALEQNYPNPFNPTTEIRYTVAPSAVSTEAVTSDRDAVVRLAVYDVLGREVVVLVDEKQLPGSYRVTFDGAGLSAGTYVYRLIYGSHAESRRMLLLK